MPTAFLERCTFIGGSGARFPYRLLRPENMDRRQRYPLVLFLHGAGERGDDNDQQLIHGVPEFARPERRRQYPCILVAPQCPAGHRWVETDWGAAAHTMPARPSVPLQLLLELLAHLPTQLPIDSKRVYVTGMSMGGFGAWELLARQPQGFAAAVLICAGADLATAPAIASVPQWVFHGARDDAVPVSRSRQMVAALRQAGGRPRFTEYPEVGHDSWNAAYGDPEMFAWLFAQKQD